MQDSSGYLEVSIENPPPGWDERQTYRKTALTEAVRVKKPVIVRTSEGQLTCEDGYVAMDSRGYFYPIAVEEFEAIYELAEPKGDDDAETGGSD